MQCRLCQIQEESMEHLYQCQVIQGIMGPIGCLYKDIFSENLDIVLNAAKKTKDLVNLRQLLLNP